MAKSGTRIVTAWVILTTIVTWIVWDIYVATNGILGDTESEVIRDWAWRYPSLAFGTGVLSGHWFWTVSQKRPLWMMYALWAVGVLIIVADVFLRLFPPLLPLYPLGVGVVMGHLMWPQEHYKESDPTHLPPE